MGRRSSNASSVHRPQDFTTSVPFVPREVFRLVLRLEAQKALDVNVAAMEQRFHVPPGYADDESLNARGELKQQQQLVPGPGTYEVPVQWPVRDATATPVAAFLSRTTRGLSPARRVPTASHISPTRRNSTDRRLNSKSANLLRPHTAIPDSQCTGKTQKSPRSRLRLPSTVDRCKLSIQVPDLQSQLNEGTSNASESFYSSLNPRSTAAFSKLDREPEIEHELVPAVGSYDIKRLWDSTASRTSMGAPSSALFGASKEKRVVTWRPALTPASCTVSTTWDSSRHYAKQKDEVVRCAAKRRLQSGKLHARALSSPQLRPSMGDTIVQSEPSSKDPIPVETPEVDADPFSWLRQRPNGEHRVNVLAAKHGLFQHIKSPTHRLTEIRRSIMVNYDGKLSMLLDDADTPVEPVYTAKPKDVRIKVSCRMPGGMLITASVYSMKKLGHFKSAILARQKRFQNVNEFDLYHFSGRKLTGLDETLVTCGVHDRSLLQIVPVVTLALVGNKKTIVTWSRKTLTTPPTNE